MPGLIWMQTVCKHSDGIPERFMGEDFRIIPEFRILRLTFHRNQDFEADFPLKVSLKILN